MCQLRLWAYRQNESKRKPALSIIPLEILRRPLTRVHQPGRKSRERKQEHNSTYEERKRIFQEAHYDNVESIGEVVALSNSVTLAIDRADVLRDPKLPEYEHPSLRVEKPPLPTKPSNQLPDQPSVRSIRTLYPYPLPGRFRPDFNTHTLD